MNRLIIFILVILGFNRNLIYAQEIDKLTLDSIYIKSLNSRYDFLFTSGERIIELNERTERIKNNFVHSGYVFYSADELFDYAYKHGKTIKLYRITHKQVSKDTIDVNFSELSLTVKKGLFFKNGLHFKEAHYSIGCLGTEGYKPDFRFAYDMTNKTWIIIGGRYKLHE
jgi:hypothetical protein